MAKPRVGTPLRISFKSTIMLSRRATPKPCRACEERKRRPVMVDSSPDTLRARIEQLENQVQTLKQSAEHKESECSRAMSEKNKQHESEVAELNEKLLAQTRDVAYERDKAERYQTKLQELRRQHKAELEQKQTEFEQQEKEHRTELAAKRRHYEVESDDENEKCQVCGRRHIGLQRERAQRRCFMRTNPGATKEDYKKAKAQNFDDRETGQSVASEHDTDDANLPLE